MDRLERIAARSIRIFSEGPLPLPTDEQVTVIFRSTRSDWTSFCLENLKKCTRDNIKIRVVPDDVYDPQFAGIDRINFMLSQVNTKYFVFLDDGIIVTPEWLTRLLWTFYDDPDVGIVSPSTTSDLGFPFCTTLDELFSLSGENAKQNSGNWEHVSTIRGRCFACRTSLLEEVGGFDYSLQSHEARMHDWCLRIKIKGHQLALSKESLVYELQLDNTDAADEKRKWIQFRRKWDLEETSDPYTVTKETKYPLLIPLTKEALSPPLVSVVVLSFDSPLRSLHDALTSVEQQTYPNKEVLLIRKGLPPHLPRSSRKPVAGIWIDGEIQMNQLLKSIWSLAQGEYIAYLETGSEYEKDHIGRLLDLIHRKRASIGIANTDAKTEIPLSFVMHLHPAIKPVHLDIRFSQDKSLKLIPHEVDTMEVVKLTEKTVKRRVKP